MIVIAVRRISVMAFLLSLACAPLWAQTAIESNAGVQFDFVNPGARSLAMGGAFVALADDATAAFTNPAGLRPSISKKEVSAEGRFWAFNTPYTSGGRLGGPPQNKGIDTASDLLSSSSQQSTGSPAFVSFVYPAGRWAVSIYGQQVSNFSFAATSQGPFVQLSNGRDARVLPFQATLGLQVARYGLSGSYKVNDWFAVGAGVIWYDFSLISYTQRFPIVLTGEQFYDASGFSDVPYSQLQTGNDRRVGVTAGLIASVTPKIHFGAVYRQGARFATTTTGSMSPDGSFSVPSVFSIGTALHPMEPLKVTLDYSRVQYSAMADNFTLAFGSGGFATSTSDFKVDDANEVHLGAEYQFLQLARPVAVRIGTWYDPDHAIRFAPADSTNPDPFYATGFRPGKNVVHGTGGAGVAFPNQLEINAGVDISSKTKTFSVSTVVRF